ncbi:penicillin acylase family protein [Desertibaculum subflavum]|uniref:penicillin acylase family protein n=1 Tax=Desertibaculum subflavum TaxID=2268458 RepID=UPI0034D167D8
MFWLAAVLIVAAGGAYLWLHQTLPRTSGTATVAGLGGKVEILRDRHGIPHIEAATQDDAYFALGFLHAQDRLWQMETQRRIAAGRLAEIFGSRAVEIDRVMRTLGLRRHAEAAVAHLSSEGRASLEAYAAGVNAFLGGATRLLPLEFLALGVTPEPWTPADSIGWLKIMAWDLGGSFRAELLRMALAKQGLSNRQIGEFLPPYPGDAPVALPDLAALYRDVGVDAVRLAAAMPGAPATGIGSNNWVVAGARSATGRPLLANDPHLGLSAPAVFYLAHWRTPEGNAIGATLPGVPVMVLGRTDHAAWGFTNTGPDVQDLYIERLDTDPRRYLTPAGPMPFETREEVIRVRGEADLRITVRRTRHGPVISDTMDRLAPLIDKDHVIALAWTALADDDRTIEAGLRAVRARHWTAFVDAFADYVAPQQNIVYADVEGNIGFLAPGRVPIRRPENDIRGLAPSPGWDARYDWQGFIPYGDLPRSLNPPGGSIVTANNKIVSDRYRYHITADWQPPYRARRIESLIAGRDAHSIDSFKAIQADVTSLAVRDLLPFLLTSPTVSARTAAALELVRQWDGRMEAGRPEPLIVTAWLRQLSRLIFADELGAVFREAWRLRIEFLGNVLGDVNGQSRWCDDITTPIRETCQQLLGQSLEEALEDLVQRYGSDARRWRWGEAHAAVSPHRPFSGLFLLGDLFDIVVPTPGDGFTVNVGQHDIRNDAAPFANRHAASFRAIYDLADLDRSIFIQSTGQSGNWMSPHYADFATPWARTEYLPMTTRRADYEPGNAGRLILQPAPR